MNDGNTSRPTGRARPVQTGARGGLRTGMEKTEDRGIRRLFNGP